MHIVYVYAQGAMLSEMEVRNLRLATCTEIDALITTQGRLRAQQEQIQKELNHAMGELVAKQAYLTALDRVLEQDVSQ